MQVKYFFSLRTREARKNNEKSDFFYDLPQELIAQHPPSRATVPTHGARQEAGAVKHDIFHNIAQYIKPGDCLILNDTRFFRAAGTRVDRSSVVSSFFSTTRATTSGRLSRVGKGTTGQVHLP